MKIRTVFFYFIVLFVGCWILAFLFPAKLSQPKLLVLLPLPTPTETPFVTYHVPQIPKKSFYTIALVGDSMTAAIGEHGGGLSDTLNQLYKSTPGDQKILIDNYAQGATNIMDLATQMNQKITVGDTIFEPLLSRNVDLILIESFGYNPLSQFPLNEGLTKQTQILQQTMTQLTRQHPQTAVMFVATIAPNKEIYAKAEEPQLSASDRVLEVNERVAYIRNHMAFSQTHAIPLIDIFDASLTQNGDGNISYINPTDDIHPSFAGVAFIDQQIANAIYSSHIFPE